MKTPLWLLSSLSSADSAPEQVVWPLRATFSTGHGTRKSIEGGEQDDPGRPPPSICLDSDRPISSLQDMKRIPWYMIRRRDVALHCAVWSVLFPGSYVPLLV